MVELAFLLTQRMNYSYMVRGLQTIRENYPIEPLQFEDMKRMEDIMRRYESAKFDYTDAAIMALSERLNITQVYTFDRRDFAIFRPRHIASLELLP